MVSALIVDCVHGRPAAGVTLRLEHYAPSGWTLIVEGLTGHDGRLPELEEYAGPGGAYRLTVTSAPYFAALGMATTQLDVTTVFKVSEDQRGGGFSVYITPNAHTSVVRL